MPRVSRKQETARSEHWLRVLVNEYPQRINYAINAQLGLGGGVHWFSPVADDEYAEYRDDAFLQRLGVALKYHALSNFWPGLGPQWDGLARTDSGALLLVEAKAYVAEAVSSCGASNPDSIAQIRNSLAETQRFLGIKQFNEAWFDGYYQYANRLAHLYLLRELNNLPAYLVFVYFVDAPDVDQPASYADWQAGIAETYRMFGLSKVNPLSPYTLGVFINVQALTNG